MGEWRDVVGYEGHYMVSDQGEILSVKKGKKKMMKVFPNAKGYLRITLTKDGKMKQVFVHRLVATSFLKEIEKGKTVNHIDGNKKNNTLSNLEIVTMSENMIHACYKLGHTLKPVDQMTLEGEMLATYDCITTASKKTGASLESIVKVCRGTRNKAGGFKWRYSKKASGGY